ncbi:MAG: enoyl-CoA hydratase/isomerase family protein, partial [Solirubrobacterales bacterium]|nr:enoyl-CoA hydratase/isomerase family protein [Solirubrobacterales bacterium]
MSYEQIEYEVGDAVATITLNRPDALNPLSPEMCSEILAALKQAESDNGVRVVVLTGAGRGFSSGADVSGFAASLTGGEKPDLELGLKELFAPIFQAQRSLEKPVIAAVNGPCVGISVALALHADLVVAAESAYFLLAFAKIGLAPDGAAVMAIARRAGAGRAAEMALLADKIPAAQAQQWGLVNQVVA